MAKKRDPGANVDLHALHVFHEVVRTGSFSAAARALGLAQPTVSQHVAALETAFGVRLLDRAGRAARPTPAGVTLHDYALRMLELRDRAAAEVSLSAGVVRGTLPVAASTIPGTYLLPAAVSAFRAQHPKVTVDVRIGDSREVEKAVAEGAAELGVSGAPPVDRRLRGQPFWRDELVLVLAPDDPWAKARLRRLSPADLGGRAFVMREEGSGTLRTLEDALAARGLPAGSLEVVCRFGSTEAVLEAVRAGVGPSWVSRRAAAADLERGTLLSLPVRGLKIERACRLLEARRRTPSPAGRAFREALLRAAQRR